jgi:hypothetical protein
MDVQPYHKVYGYLSDDKVSLQKIIKSSKELSKLVPAEAEKRAKAFVIEEYIRLAQTLMVIAKRKGIELRWGGDWDRDGDRFDQSFNDLPHVELV